MPNPVRPVRAVVAIALACRCCALAAQPSPAAPDAGRLLEQTAPGLPVPPSGRSVLPAPAAPAAPLTDATPVRVNGLSFSGNSVFSAAELTALMGDVVGRNVSWGELNQAVQRITAAYQARGYVVARALIPRQDLAARQQVLQVQVLEGRLGAVSLPPGAAGEPAALAAALLQAQGLQAGVPLRREPLERAVLLLGERLGDDASVTLSAGPTVGSTDVAVVLPTGRPTWRGQWRLDNQGNRYAGEWRTSGEARRASLATLGDALGLRGIVARGLQYLSADYQVPVGYDGWQLGAVASALRYELCCEFAPLGAQGDAQILGASARYPLRLGAQGALFFHATLAQRNSKDQTRAGTVADKTARTTELGFSFNRASASALEAGQLMLTLGRLNLSATPAALAADAVAAQSQGGFSKLRLDYQRVMPLGARAQLSVRLAAQAAGKNLDSAEKISLGGPQGLRAYPVGEAAGDEGATLSVEARRVLQRCAAEPCGGQWVVSAFADAGHIRQHKNLWAGALAAGQPNAYSLYGAGLGLGYQSGPWQVSLTLATRLGRNPGADANGNASDARNQRTRGWLQISRSL
ncbi:MAG: ShlB/FhaC/HecB family hemolysin secretion/activation protein [Ramlibacter sp.]|nr:ShlB/FhaC/HecB family hemolysin secretion/activation protein [Ramlibacter sp.]